MSRLRGRVEALEGGGAGLCVDCWLAFADLWNAGQASTERIRCTHWPRYLWEDVIRAINGPQGDTAPPGEGNR